MPGIMMSRRTRSGRKVSISSRAPDPDAAVLSRYPSPRTSSMMEMLIGSSSTTRMASRLVMAIGGSDRLPVESFWLPGSPRRDGQGKDESGSAARAVLGPDSPTQGDDDFPANRESQAGAARPGPGLPRLNELVEDRLQLIGGDSNSAVAHGDPHAFLDRVHRDLDLALHG